MNNPVLSWFGIVRLGLVQTGLGAIVVLTTSTLNRVMVVELAMPAILPGALVAIHYALQVFRPAWGHGSDLGARRTPWIVGGMAVLATGGLMASVATAWMTTHPLFGVALAVAAFGLIGVGVGAAGTSLLVLLAKRTDDNRRAAAATIVWVMMIAGLMIATLSMGIAMLQTKSMPKALGIVTVVVGVVAASGIGGWFAFMGSGPLILVIAGYLYQRTGQPEAITIPDVPDQRASAPAVEAPKSKTKA